MYVHATHGLGPQLQCPLSRFRRCPGVQYCGQPVHVSRVEGCPQVCSWVGPHVASFLAEALVGSPAVWSIDAFPLGAWPRDAAVDTHKQAGRQSTALTGASSRSCHVTKRFRILATLKQGNKRMYSKTSGYVHMGLRLD